MSPTTRIIRSSLVTVMVLSTVSCDGSTAAQRSTAASSTTSPQHAPSTPAPTPVCAGARTTFGAVSKVDVLTELATAVTITSSAGGPLDAPMRPVRRYTAEVLAVGDAPEALVYEAFAKKIGDTTPLPRLGDVARGDGNPMSIGGAGRFVGFEGVTAVKAMFDYACGGVTTRGVVSSWLTGISGVLQCDDPGRPPHTPMEDEARALACGT